MSASLVRAARPVRTVVTGTAVLSTTMLLVSAANYLLNLVLARVLDPADFGDASLAITLVLAAAVVAASLQLVASKTVAAEPDSLEAVRRTLVRAALGVGLVVVALLGGGAWIIADALSVSTPWMLVIIALGLPVYFVQAVHRGALQGQLRFGRLALSYGVEAAVRVGVVLALVAAGLGVIGAAIGIALSFVASAVIARARPRREGARPTAAPWSLVGSTAVIAVIVLVGQTLLNNADVIIAKAAFDAETAGVYAAAAVLGRAVFFVSWSVVQVVFPVIASASSSASHRARAVATALGVIVVVGAAAGVAAVVAGESLLVTMFGEPYRSAAGLLLPYVVATSVFAVANLLATVDLARGRWAGAAVLACGAVVQTVALVVWARTPDDLVLGQVVGTSLTVVALVAVAVARKIHPRPLAKTL